MNEVSRKQLNHNIRAFAHGTLKLDEETYRDVIRSVTTNKEHITDCTMQEAELVLMALRRFRGGQLGGRQRGNGTGTAGINEPQHNVITHLMEYLNWNWGHTAKFCKRITGKSNTRLCSAAELVKLTQGMIAIVNQNIESGRLRLSPDELAKYRLHTQPHRFTKSEISNPKSQITPEVPCNRP
jgi:hypothetical protein